MVKPTLTCAPAQKHECGGGCVYPLFGGDKLLDVGVDVHPYLAKSLQMVVFVLGELQHIAIDVVVVFAQPLGLHDEPLP